VFSSTESRSTRRVSDHDNQGITVSKNIGSYYTGYKNHFAENETSVTLLSEQQLLRVFFLF
jgi:hypothetical protein